LRPRLKAALAIVLTRLPATMSRYHRAFYLLANGGIRDEFAQRYRAAWDADRDIRQRSRSARPPETYYDAALEDHRLGELAKAPWRELLARADAQPGLAEQFPDELKSLRAKATPSPSPDATDFEGHLDEDVAEFYLDNGDLGRLAPLLDANNVPYDTHEFPTGKEVVTIDFGGPDGPWVVEPGEPLAYWREAREWVESASERPHEFYEERDESAEFWDGVGPGAYLYHATEGDNVDSILSTGLEARSDTRGMSNRDIGPAVFAISGESMDDVHAALDAYGEAVIRIDLGAMKSDGYMPEITGETPLEEADLQESLAHGIGYEYEAERESDYMDDTVAILGDVPPKYLSLYEG